MLGKSGQDSNRSQRILEVETQRLPWFKLFFVPLACYVPAFLLVFLSFHLFKSVNTSNPDVNPANSVEAVQKLPDSPKGANLRLENSPLAREYIRAEVQNEVKAQSEQAAKDEIDKLKADWKGDLFGQMAFPILFAIASIFAAFAVKDILTEILKEQEKEKVKQELSRELEIQIVPKAIKVNQEKLTDRLEAIEAYTNWLEHLSLDIIVNQVIDEIKETSEVEEIRLLALEKLLERRNMTLAQISSELDTGYFELFKQIENSAITVKVKSLKLSESFEHDLLKLCSQSSGNMYEGRYTRMTSIFQMQKCLCIDTLHKLGKDADSSLEEEIKQVINLINHTTENLEHESKETHRKIKRFNEENPDIVSF